MCLHHLKHILQLSFALLCAVFSYYMIITLLLKVMKGETVGAVEEEPLFMMYFH